MATEIDRLPPTKTFQQLATMAANQGDVPCYTVVDGLFAVLALSNAAVEVCENPLIHVNDGATLLIRAMQGSTIDPSAISCAVGGTVIFAHDGNTYFPVDWPAMDGTLLNQPAGIAGGAGPTAFRPTSVIGPLSIGCVFLDTTLGYPIWWDGTDWLDSTGAAV